LAGRPGEADDVSGSKSEKDRHHGFAGAEGCLDGKEENRERKERPKRRDANVEEAGSTAQGHGQAHDGRSPG